MTHVIVYSLKWSYIYHFIFESNSFQNGPQEPIKSYKKSLVVLERVEAVFKLLFGLVS